MTRVSIAEASRRMGVSPDTIRRRIKKGELPAFKERSPKGDAWLVDIPDDQLPAGGDGETQALRETIKVLQQELEYRRREIQELHVLLRDTRSLLAPPAGRPWWKRLAPWTKVRA